MSGRIDPFGRKFAAPAALAGALVLAAGWPGWGALAGPPGDDGAWPPLAGEVEARMSFTPMVRRGEVNAWDAAGEGSSISVLMEALVLKPLMRPISSINRLLAATVDTGYDIIVPDGFEWLTDTIDSAPPPPPLALGPGMDLDAWERALDDLTGATASRGRMRYLIDGEAFFSAFTDAVEQAEESIHIRTYIFDTDDYAVEIADLLKRRSREVDVRVMFDGMGTVYAGGVDPASLPDGFEKPESITSYLALDSDIDVRVRGNPFFTGDHVKTFIFDRRFAFMGGMNIGREYRYDWHDMMIEVRGPVVNELDREFAQAWRHAGPLGDLALFVRGERARTGNAASADDYPVRLLYTRPGDSQIYDAQIAAIRGARRYVYVETPYLADDLVVYELVMARARGVDVRVILPQGNDNRIMDYGNIVAANLMLGAGVRVYMYSGFTHAKALVVDGWASVGTANLDRLSLRVNQEVNLATSHPPAVEALLDELFAPDFVASDELTAPLDEPLSYSLAEFIANGL